MNFFLKSLYEEIQHIKKLEQELNHSLKVRLFARSAIRPQAQEELDTIYQKALKGQNRQATQDLKGWLTVRRRQLSNLSQRRLAKRAISWRALDALGKARNRVKDLLDLEELHQTPAPPPFTTPQPSGASNLAILKPNVRPWFDRQIPILQLLIDLGADSPFSNVIDAEELISLAKQTQPGISTLILANSPLKHAEEHAIRVLKAKGVKLIFDDSVVWGALETDKASSYRDIQDDQSLCDALLTSRVDAVFSRQKQQPTQSFYTPPALRAQKAPSIERSDESTLIRGMILVERLEELRKLHEEHQEIWPSFSEIFLIKSKHISMEAWSELLQQGPQLIPNLKYSESPQMAAANRDLCVLFFSGSRNYDVRFALGMLQFFVDHGCTLLLPSSCALPFYAETLGKVHYRDPKDLLQKIHQWVESPMLREELKTLWKQYQRCTHEPWLCTYRALQSIKTFSLASTQPEIAQISSLRLASFKCRLPKHSANQVRYRFVKPEAKPWVSVILTNYNYASYIVETLEALKQQTFPHFEVIIIDDVSSDSSLELIQNWVMENESHFEGVLILKNEQNAGPSMSRNNAILHAQAPLLFIQDADNPTLAHCFKELVQLLSPASPYAFAYPTLQIFGENTGLLSNVPWDPLSMAKSNKIDTMALLRTSAWSLIGGYEEDRKGWEDYDLWCRFAEHGFLGIHADQVLALYRTHPTSLLKNFTLIEENNQKIRAVMNRDHPWLHLP